MLSSSNPCTAPLSPEYFSRNVVPTLRRLFLFGFKRDLEGHLLLLSGEALDLLLSFLDFTGVLSLLCLGERAEKVTRRLLLKASDEGLLGGDIALDFLLFQREQVEGILKFAEGIETFRLLCDRFGIGSMSAYLHATYSSSRHSHHRLACVHHEYRSKYCASQVCRALQSLRRPSCQHCSCVRRL